MDRGDSSAQQHVPAYIYILFFLFEIAEQSTSTLFSMHPLYILLLGLLLLPTSCCSSNDTLMAGRVLTVGDKLVSRNGKFALGFFQPAVSTISKSSNNS
jgi:hypothetical protein